MCSHYEGCTDSSQELSAEMSYSSLNPVAIHENDELNILSKCRKLQDRAQQKSDKSHFKLH